MAVMDHPSRGTSNAAWSRANEIAFMPGFERVNRESGTERLDMVRLPKITRSGRRTSYANVCHECKNASSSRRFGWTERTHEASRFPHHHLLFADGARSRAFGIYGIVLGLAGAAGFQLGGILVTLDLAGLGWRAVFFAIEAAGSPRMALLAACALFALSIMACAAFLTWMRRATAG
jgi:hypothetical protein